MINTKINRLNSYVGGLDDVLEGGIPENYNILVCGNPGTYKSTLCYQFCYYGALQGEASMYITLEESIPSLTLSMSKYGMGKNLDNFVKFDLSALRKLASSKWSLDRTRFRVDWFPTIQQAIGTLCQELNIKRLAFDSLNALYELVSVDERRIRKELFEFMHFLKANGLTSMLISEIPLTYNSYGKFGVEDFLSDGIILLEAKKNGLDVEKYMRLVKMRSTKHETKYLPVQISDNGLGIYLPKKL